MKLFPRLQTAFRKFFRLLSDTHFPLQVKAQRTLLPYRQSLLIQSREEDELQLVHAPLKNKNRAFIYSIVLGDILGELDEKTTRHLRRLFGNGFCLDGEIFALPTVQGKRFLTLLVYDTSEFLKGEVLPMVVE